MIQLLWHICFTTNGRAQTAVTEDRGVDSRIEKTLRAWRLNEARTRGVPAFRILTDKALRAIAVSEPTTADALLEIPGIGMSTIEKYGPAIYHIVKTAP